MIATLPMYDFAHLRNTTDRFWRFIQTELKMGPTHLTRQDDLWSMWTSPDLVLGQTCGMPFRTRLRDQVKYVITPDFGLKGCPPGFYNSVLLSRENITDLAQLDGKTIAYNESLSQSGWAAPISFLSKHAIAPKAGVKTGAHINSMRAVLSGTADFCGVDAQTFALICNMTDDFNDLRILAHTEPTPGLPYICALRFDPKGVADAVLRAYETLDGADKSSLRLKGFVHIDTAHYFSVPSPTSPDKMFD